jgi:hypothetical protein
MSRRRVVRYMGGALAATALGGLYPRRAQASHCLYVTCPSQSNPNAHGCCEEGRTCCYDNTGNATDCCLPEEECRSGKCVDPCEGLTQCTDACCQRFGQGECCGQLCCTSDQVCDRSRNVCCPPESDPPKCNEPEPACEKRANELVNAQKSTVGGSDHAPGGLEAATSLAVLDLYSRYKEYDKCPQVPDDSDCAAGGRCDPSTLVCRQCAGSGRRRWVGHASLERRGPDRTRRRGTGGQTVSPKQLAERLGERYKPRDRALRRLLAAARGDREGPGPYPELAEALADYRKEIVRLRRSVAKGNGGPPQKLLVEMCDELTRGLKALGAAALSDDRAEAQRLALSAEQPMKRGIKRARQLPRLLGCGKRCL